MDLEPLACEDAGSHISLLFAYPIKLETCCYFFCFFYFSGSIHFFKGKLCKKFQDNSRTNGHFFNFQEFSSTNIKLKTFSRSVLTLHKNDNNLKSAVLSFIKNVLVEK